MADIRYYDDEFPLLEENGLYATQTSGDGDCLFHSLSDQLYGHENCHLELRQRVVEHLRAHSSYFKAFIDVAPVRRAPRRRAVVSSRADLETHTQGEIDKAFEQRLQRMQKSGVFGDNLEIQAFAREFGVNVKIYQRDYAYVICADNGSGNAGKNNEDRKVVHIAYHMWEHYSSIRNRSGPHTGPPLVCLCPISSLAAADFEETLVNSSVVLPWMEDVVAASLPHHEAPEKIRETLERCNGDVNTAVSQLLDEWDTASVSDSETLAHEEDEPQVEEDIVEVRQHNIEQQEPELEQQLAPEEQQLQIEQQQSQVAKQQRKPQPEILWSEPDQNPLQVSHEQPKQVPLPEHLPETQLPELERQQSQIWQSPSQQQQMPTYEYHNQVEQHLPFDQQSPEPGQLRFKPPQQPPEPENHISDAKQPEQTTIHAAVVEVNQEGLSRIKRQKSPDGSSVTTTSISDDTSSVASSFSSSMQSSSSSESEISIMDRRRRKPVSPKSLPAQPTRRSPRIRAKIAGIVERPLHPPPDPVSKGPSKSYKQCRQVKRKLPANEGTKRKDIRMQTVTVGIRELYV